jgi:hypothetical protein
MYFDFLHGSCKMVQSGLDRSETADIGPKLSGPKTRPAVRSSTFMRPQTRPTAYQTKDRSGDRSQTGPPDLYSLLLLLVLGMPTRKDEVRTSTLKYAVLIRTSSRTSDARDGVKSKCRSLVPRWMGVCFVRRDGTRIMSGC